MTHQRDSLSCARKCWWSKICQLFCFLLHKRSRINSFVTFSERLWCFEICCMRLFSRILLDHRFPTNVFLTSVDDVCPNQIYHCPARNFSFIMEIIHLLVRCPHSGKYSPCAQIPNRMQNSTLPLRAVPVFDPEPAQVTVRVVSQKFWLFVTATAMRFGSLIKSERSAVKLLNQ